MTAFTSRGGNDPTVAGGGGGGMGREDWCRLLECLLDALTPEACKRLGIDVDRLQRCLRRLCFHTRAVPGPVIVSPGDLSLIEQVARQVGLLPPR